MSSSNLYEIALTMIPGIGPVVAKSLLAYCGTAENAFKESTSILSKIPGIGPVIAGSISSFTDFSKAEKEQGYLSDKNIRALFFTSEEYPYRLKHIPDSPIMIYVQGNIDLNAERILGIVGTRKPTFTGIEICHDIIRGLKNSNTTIISGMAYGIDIIAHRAASDNGLITGGVIAHGLDRLYPARHWGTAHEMIGNGGGLITEYTTGTNPDAPNFPKRNRIVAGLCDAILVIESAEKGGSLITADLAFQYDRDVMAVPGRVKDINSSGCNALIKSNKASLVENAEDIKINMNWDFQIKSTNKQQSIPLDLTKDEKFVLEKLNKTILSIDHLTASVKMSPGTLSHVLLELEIRDLIEILPGKNIKRK